MSKQILTKLTFHVSKEFCVTFSNDSEKHFVTPKIASQIFSIYRNINQNESQKILRDSLCAFFTHPNVTHFSFTNESRALVHINSSEIVTHFFRLIITQIEDSRQIETLTFIVDCDIDNIQNILNVQNIENLQNLKNIQKLNLIKKRY